jgi:hypothetical protein
MKELLILYPTQENKELRLLQVRIEMLECMYVRSVLTGGKEKKGKNSGFFIEPAVVTDVKLSMKVAKEEIFGPVAAIIK